MQFLDYLREEGLAQPRQAPDDGSAVGQLERRYARYLQDERGLVDVTVVNYGGLVHRFLVEQFGQGPTDLVKLTSRHIADYLLRQVRTMSPKRAQLMGCALRSFLRFLFFEAETTADLSFAVPTVRQFRKATVPQYLVAADVERVLASCDLTTAVGRRDHAILLMLARLGLRASEVVKLELGDLRWREGEFLVRGKGKLHDRLPLPKDVGKALTLYLTRVRATCSSRRVFIRMRAPLRGFTDAAAVTSLVKRAIERAGLKPPHRGAHLLRHSLATGMIQRGATMAEIGQLLRHRSPNTTELYAKVDFEGLRGVSLAWVGGGR
jgi:site-specific recombinase XerD